jgi:hypothetical protein
MLAGLRSRLLFDDQFKCFEGFALPYGNTETRPESVYPDCWAIFFGIVRLMFGFGQAWLMAGSELFPPR